jgi:hypothetical protein
MLLGEEKGGYYDRKRQKNVANVLIIVGFGCLLYFSETSRPLTIAGIVMLLAGMLIQMFFKLKRSKTKP